jgi:hypothetical protein
MSRLEELHGQLRAILLPPASPAEAFKNSPSKPVVDETKCPYCGAKMYYSDRRFRCFSLMCSSIYFVISQIYAKAGYNG